LTFYENSLLLYGGFGSEKYLGLAKFSLKDEEWQTPKLEGKDLLSQKLKVDRSHFTDILWAFSSIIYTFLVASDYSRQPTNSYKSTSKPPKPAI
jgi:hypothetical protein